MVHTSQDETTTKFVLVIMGSTRAGRHCPQIASWVADVARTSSDLLFELIDLADWHLPMDDEPGIPALGQYTQPHTLAWSRRIASADAFIFVTPQYNWGYPAPLKNAIDHLYMEWNDKPAMIVSYGGHGGGKCAVQLRQVLEGMHMRPTATMPGLSLTREMVQGGPIDSDQDFASSVDSVRQAVRELAAALSSPAA